MVIEIKSPGMDFNWKLIKKKQKQTEDKIMRRQIKLPLISFTEQISETLPSNLIIFFVGSKISSSSFNSF